MNPHSSSTSNSESGDDASENGEGATKGRPIRRRSDLHEALVVAVWILIFLVGADVTINRVFRLPLDPRVEAKGRLQVYFNYGWSIEAKLRRAVGPTDETSSPLMLAGWIERDVTKAPPVPAPSPGGLVVSSYGMSFSNQVVEGLAEVDPRIQLRLFGGPGAPVNHAYATYERDRVNKSNVVILGILGSSVQGLATNNGMTWRFEGPAPFTYPRYFQETEGLRAEWPMVRSLEDFRARLADPAGWEAYVSELRATDAFYNTFLFRHDVSDQSALIRLVRRAVAQRWQSSKAAEIHGPSGFVLENPLINSLREIVSAFAANARREGKMPIALLIQDQGYRDHVYRALEPVLTRDQIPYLSTHTICPDSDPRNFLPDGHFTHDANRKISQALLEVIRRELPERRS
jgi:hypothetical protein